MSAHDSVEGFFYWKHRAEAAEAKLADTREEMNRRLRAAEDRDAALNTEISGLQAKLAEAQRQRRFWRGQSEDRECWLKKREAELAAARELFEKQKIVSRHLDNALGRARERERVLREALHNVVVIQGDTDTGDLARAALRSSEEPKP